MKNFWRSVLTSVMFVIGLSFYYAQSVFADAMWQKFVCALIGFAFLGYPACKSWYRYFKTIIQ